MAQFGDIVELNETSAATIVASDGLDDCSHSKEKRDQRGGDQRVDHNHKDKYYDENDSDAGQHLDDGKFLHAYN